MQLRHAIMALRLSVTACDVSEMT